MELWLGDTHFFLINDYNLLIESNNEITPIYRNPDQKQGVKNNHFEKSFNPFLWSIFGKLFFNVPKIPIIFYNETHLKLCTHFLNEGRNCCMQFLSESLKGGISFYRGIILSNNITSKYKLNIKYGSFKKQQ